MTEARGRPCGPLPLQGIEPRAHRRRDGEPGRGLDRRAHRLRHDQGASTRASASRRSNSSRRLAVKLWNLARSGGFLTAEEPVTPFPPSPGRVGARPQLRPGPVFWAGFERRAQFDGAQTGTHTGREARRPLCSACIHRPRSARLGARRHPGPIPAETHGPEAPPQPRTPHGSVAMSTSSRSTTRRPASACTCKPRRGAGSLRRARPS